MPRIKDIVDEAVNIALDRLNVEPLVRHSIMLSITRKAQNAHYYTRVVSNIDVKEQARKKKLALIKASQVRINLSLFSDFELEVARTVCKIHNISIDDFVLNRRKRELVDARFQFSSVLVLQLKYTLQKVGRLLSKDHSTIIHAIKTHRDFYDTITEYRLKYNETVCKVEEFRSKESILKTNPNIIIESYDSRRKRKLKGHAKTD